MDFDRALIGENRSLAAIIRAADPTVPVPTCPGWTLRQLATHVGRGDRWAATMVRERAEAPVDIRTVADGKAPVDPDELTAWLHGGADAILDAVAAVGADAPVWTFRGTRPAAWWVRRRLHEAVVHRADAALAVGVAFEITPDLAADAISEFLDLLPGLGADPATTPLADGATLHLHGSDEGEWLIHGDLAGITWEPGHGKGDAAVRGTAAQLLLALTRRAPADSVEVLGDSAVWTRWLARTKF